MIRKKSRRLQSFVDSLIHVLRGHLLTAKICRRKLGFKKKKKTHNEWVKAKHALFETIKARSGPFH